MLVPPTLVGVRGFGEGRERFGTMTQVFANLINNATKYSEIGATSDCGTSNANEAVVTVRDDGIRIAREHLASVFDHVYAGEPVRSARPRWSRHRTDAWPGALRRSMAVR